MIDGRAPRRQRLVGTVVTAGKSAKTITVAVNRHPWHQKVRKQVRRARHYLVHDPQERARTGDRVIIEASRPLSKRKHFRLAEILASGPAADPRRAAATGTGGEA